MRLRLSPRLLKIAGLVPEHSVVADIGTDHALLPVYLVATGRCPRAVATDVKPGPLEAARRTVAAFGLERQVDLRLGFGATVLEPHEADVVVIAGMGGSAITAILDRSPNVLRTARRLILQPMNSSAAVRLWLLGHGFTLAEEELVREGQRIYEVLVAEPLPVVGRAGRGGEHAGAVEEGGRDAAAAPGGELPDDLGLEVGARLWESRHPLLREFIEQKRDRCRRVLARIEAGGLRADHRACGRFREKLARLERLLTILEGRGELAPRR